MAIWYGSLIVYLLKGYCLAGPFVESDVVQVLSCWLSAFVLFEAVLSSSRVVWFEVTTSDVIREYVVSVVRIAPHLNVSTGLQNCSLMALDYQRAAGSNSSACTYLPSDLHCVPKCEF